MSEIIRAGQRKIFYMFSVLLLLLVCRAPLTSRIANSLLTSASRFGLSNVRLDDVGWSSKAFKKNVNILARFSLWGRHWFIFSFGEVFTAQDIPTSFSTHVALNQTVFTSSLSVCVCVKHEQGTPSAGSREQSRIIAQDSKTLLKSKQVHILNSINKHFVPLSLGGVWPPLQMDGRENTTNVLYPTENFPNRSKRKDHLRVY